VDEGHELGVGGDYLEQDKWTVFFWVMGDAASSHGEQPWHGG
jgi:hypothetical protein